MFRTLSATTAIAALPLCAAAQSGAPVDQGPKNVPSFKPAFELQTRAPAQPTDVALEPRTVASGLEHPWAIAVLPEGAGYLVTERSGALRHIASDGRVSDPIAGVPDVLAERQGGLLDVKLAPDFAETRRIFLTYAKPVGDGMSATAAASAVLSEDLASLNDVDEIFVQSPASPNPMHYGSRIVPDGEGHVFITLGEHFTEEERVLAQDLGTTYGKIVRVSADGSVPGGNPFTGQPSHLPDIWSFGHRNPQGAAIHPETGDIWAIEHGPQGGDELNLIAAGGNYGWPVVSYGQNYDGSEVGTGTAAHAPRGFVEPRYYWDPVIAPGDMAFYRGAMFEDWTGDILIGSLVSGGIVRLDLDGDTVRGEERLVPELGRTRDVTVDADGSILLVTDYPDGSLIRVTPAPASN